MLLTFLVGALTAVMFRIAGFTAIQSIAIMAAICLVIGWQQWKARA